nr:hypothetical protein [uncultured Legionella sp.]
MKSCFQIVFGIILLSLCTFLHAESPITKRIDQFANNKVRVWKTIIYPSSKQVLPMHRHEHDRVLVALTDGVLKITNDKGAVHHLKLKKDQAYYLTKDMPGELHNDENVSQHTIKVIVVELN